ncbi:MAG: transketolase C-terminal domain-containing protein, partial [Candidatus Geothermincolia bacterium]
TRESMAIGQQNAREVIKRAASEFEDVFGRNHGELVETYRLEGARFVIVAMGSIAAESRVAVDSLRNRGIDVGVLRVRFFRPFPTEELRKLCTGKEGLLVIDRDISYGNEGALFTEVKGALYGKVDAPASNLIVGIGGRDVTHGLIEEMTLKAMKGQLAEVTWGDSHISPSHEVTREVLGEFRELLD